MQLNWTMIVAGAGIVLGVGALHSLAQTVPESEQGTSQATEAKEPASEQTAKANETVGDREGRYEQAVWDALHFPGPDSHVTDAQCLACHQEVLDRRVLPTSPAGLKASETLAWYQTLDTYTGKQETFHRRHLVTPFAKSVMNLSCTFCHRGHDPRDEAPGTSATAATQDAARFTLRKGIDPTKTCLRCHGNFPNQTMGLPVPWPDIRTTLENDNVKNGCLVCHAEQFRTNRHNVTYLNGAKIEELAKESSDVCYGCHGGRAWYRISYPYPRHPWPGMSATVPDWAKDRPTESDPEFRSDGGAQ